MISGLAGRVGIVTGAGKGLGRAFALDLAAAGASVVVNNRSRDGRSPADEVTAEIRAAGGEAEPDHTDVASAGAAEAILDTAVRRYGRIDFLVTSAAITGVEMLHKSTPERFDRVIATNLGGTAHLVAACATRMREARFGRIVLIASTAGLHGEPGGAAYSASKGAIIAFGRTVAAEGERRNVLTNIVLPYAITQLTEHGMAPRLRDRMPPEAVAPLVTALVQPGSELNGQVLISGGGVLRAASAVEWGSVPLPAGPLDPANLAALIATSRSAPPREFRDAQTGFLDLAQDG